MDRTPPSTENDAIQLYQRTYYSLLKSTRGLRVRSLEETHGAMASSLHTKAHSPEIDMSALVYAYQRLPPCIAETSVVLMGQMQSVFARAGFPEVESWQRVKAPARRRKFYFNGEERILAAFISSVSDIDDFLPCLTAFQIEWKKIHRKLSMHSVKERLISPASPTPDQWDESLLEEVRIALELGTEDFDRLRGLWPGKKLATHIMMACSRNVDFEVRVLAGSMSDYRKAFQAWWKRVEEVTPRICLRERPVYFVSSNVHSLVNLVTTAAGDLREQVFSYIRSNDPEELKTYFEDIVVEGDAVKINNLIYYCSKFLIGENTPDGLEKQARRESLSGIHRVSDPHSIDVEAQIFELSKLVRANIDPRNDVLTAEEWASIAESDAIILNIDYPLGMAAYHLFSQVSSSCASVLGFYAVGKAATLNGRVGDLMIPNVVHDEHTRNTFLFNNCFTANDVARTLRTGDVFDNQKAVTVKGTLLQNREFMHLFYQEGYTDIEMEAGPYLCALYEAVQPRRHPLNEIVSLFPNVPFDIGLIHYASDTPISRHENLLSKSMSFQGVDATYATTSAVLCRILKNEAKRQKPKT